MKKIFTLIFALMGLSAAVNAATIEDVVKINQTYSMVAQDWQTAGTNMAKGTLFGDDHFLAPGGLNWAANKGSWSEDWTEYVAANAGTERLNCMRVKTSGTEIDFKAVGGSVIKVWGERHASRPIVIYVDGKEAAKSPVPADAEGAGYVETKLADDATVKIYSTGDLYIGRILVEVPVQPGQPVATVGDQTKGADGVWYKEVSCTADVSGTACDIYYTTDGTDPDNTSAKYVQPLKITQNCNVKFTSYMGTRKLITSSAPVSFKFAAPAITVDGSSVTIANAENIDGDIMYTVNDSEEQKYAGAITLEKSALISAYTVIKNAQNDFVSASTSQEAYLMKALDSEQTLLVTGTYEEGEPTEAGEATYVVNPDVKYDDNYIYFRGATIKPVLSTADQVMVDGTRCALAYQNNSSAKLSFRAPEDKDVKVTLLVSLNSHKNDDDMRCGFGITPNGGKVTYIANGTVTDGVTEGGVDENNVLETTVSAGNIYTISSWNNTGNIFVSYVKLTPVEADAIKNVATAVKNGAIFNLAGQQVSADYKGVVIKNGVKVLNK